MALSRYLNRSPRLTRWLDSSPFLWAGVAALIAGIPLHLTGNEASCPGSRPNYASSQELIDSTSSSDVELPSPTGWNVLLISIDTLRPDRLGVYGYDRPISPRIDQLAADGVVFSRAYSTAPWTLPAQMSMITGLLPSAHGAQLSPVFTTEVERLSDARTTMTEVLSGSGYRTGAFTGGSFLGKKFGFEQGFDHLETGGVLADLWGNAQQWLESDSQRPFFLFLHTYEVHNYEPSKEFDDQWVRPVEPNTARRFSDRRQLRNFILTNGFFSLNKDELTFISDLYDATIAQADRVVGEILGYLQSEGLEDSTMVIVTSDHGEEFFEHGGTGHGFTFYEEMLRIPWILRFPGGPEELVIDQRVQLIDIMPTILDLVGLVGPGEMQGKSLTGLIRGDEIRGLEERALIAEASHLGNARSLIHDDAKIIRGNYLPSHVSSIDRALYNLRQLVVRSDDLFFDLDRDPAELSPRDPSNFEQGRSLQKLLQAYEAVADEGEIASPVPEVLSEETIEDLRAIGYLD